MNILIDQSENLYITKTATDKIIRANKIHPRVCRGLAGGCSPCKGTVGVLGLVGLVEGGKIFQNANFASSGALL